MLACSHTGWKNLSKIYPQRYVAMSQPLHVEGMTGEGGGVFENRYQTLWDPKGVDNKYSQNPQKTGTYPSAHNLRAAIDWTNIKVCYTYLPSAADETAPEYIRLFGSYKFWVVGCARSVDEIFICVFTGWVHWGCLYVLVSTFVGRESRWL